MEFDTLNTVLWFLVVLSIIVFVHEWGHYWVARRNGVRVEVFSIGFGPEIFGWYDKAGTRWRVSAVPLGGYVKMFGMAEDGEADSAQSFLEKGAGEASDSPHELTEDEKAVSFAHKTVGQRAAIVFAGPAINFIFAVLVLAAIAMSVGVPQVRVSVGEVVPESAAAAAGLQAEDVLVRLNNAKIDNPAVVQEIVSANPGQSLPLVVSRDAQEIELNVVPDAIDQDGQTVGRLGIRMQGIIGEHQRLNPLTAAWFGVEKTVTITGQALTNIGKLLIGQGNFKDLGGPIAIAQMSGQAAEQGALQLFFFMAVLSINLGLINLFPIPILDGGHLLFMGIEAVRGRPLGERAQEYGFRIGLALVLILMVSVTWNDIVRVLGL
ncbi:MAG: RIP metalloprotease RseP [Rhodospirillales bacterium]|nr:RIP metalloprotease RseP [Rhodospirillales bacterium]MBO6786739.1 RIP metalloprotease RseP [Rhodospirillales bacterium]